MSVMLSKFVLASKLHLHRPTWLLTFISSPSMVVALCAHLLIGH